jgi:sugar O-acyltransferase (sialic acid O-acetyltransferase NeuD family)
VLDNKPFIVLVGGGGHCVSVIDVIEKENKYTIKGILDSKNIKGNVLGYPILGGDDKIAELVNDRTYFLITVGQIKTYTIREKIATVLEKNKAKLAVIVSPLAYVSKYAIIKEGTVVMHHAFLNAATKIGKHCIINTKANIEHGVRINDFCHISTCSVINGDSLVGKGTFIGSNATISNGIVIKKNSIISAGQFIKK